MKRFLLGIVAAFFALSAMAERDGRYFMDVKEQYIKTENVESHFDNWFDLDTESRLVKASEETDMFGMQHTVYRQYYKNIEVEHCMILVHSVDGYVRSVNGYLMERGMHDGMPPAVGSLRSSANDGVCFVSVNADGETRYRPAYKTYSDNGAMTYYIDVENGDTVKVVSNVYDATNYKSAKCIGVTKYSGVQEDISCTLADDYYLLADLERGIKLYNAYNGFGQSSLSTYVYTSPILGGLLTEVTVKSSDKGWIGFESEPDLYFVIKDEYGEVIYNGKEKGNIIKDVSSYPITWNLKDDYIIFTKGYSIHFYDDDSPLDDDYAGSITYNKNEPQTSNFVVKNGNISGTVTILPNPAIDVYWGTQKAYDYFSETFNKKGFNDKFIELYYPVPPAFFSGNDINASAGYDSINDIYYMCFGKGNAGVANPLVSLDLVSHEFTHNVTESNGKGGLVYQGESGALNESFSDIFACCVEYYVRGEDGNWEIGESIGEGVLTYVTRRSMNNPKKYGQPDTYKGKYWTSDEEDHGGVHTNRRTKQMVLSFVRRWQRH